MIRAGISGAFGLLGRTRMRAAMPVKSNPIFRAVSARHVAQCCPSPYDRAMARGESIVCRNCGTKLYAVYPNPGSFKRSEDRPAVVEPLGNAPGDRLVQVTALGVAHCPECGTDTRVLD